MRRDDSTKTLFKGLDPALGSGDYPALDVLVARDPELRKQLESDSQLREELVAYVRGLQAAESQLLDDHGRELAAPPDVSGYEVHGVIGRGAMGVVYKARQISVGRPVALKVLSFARLGNPTSVARFRREADLAARFSHPNIVQVYDAGTLDGVPYIAEELVDGSTLARILDGKPLAAEEAARLIRTLATAIEYAHRRGVIHRDLKPSNVLIDSTGVPKVADFGLAKLLAGEDLLTKVGEIAGTPKYMAPEQATGKTEVGPETDVYALGVILYEALTSRLPIEGQSDIETLQRVLVDEATPPRLLRPGIPEDLQTICLTCLEKDPRNRYRTAQALADDLTRYLEHWPILARPAGRIRRIAKWARRRPTTAAVSCVVAVSLIAAAFGGWWHSLRLSEALDESNALRLEADSQRQQAEDNSQNLRRQLFPAKIRVAYTAAQLSDVGRAKRVLAEAFQESDEQTRDCFAFRHVWGTCHEEERVFRAHQGEVYFATFSPDGKTVATGGEDGAVILWDLETGRELAALRRHTSCVNQMVYSSDGCRLVTVSCDKSIRLWDMNTYEELATLAHGKGAFLTVANSPDGKRLVTAGERSIGVWDWNTLKVAAPINVDDAMRIDAARFIDHDRLVINGYGERLHVWSCKANRWGEVPAHTPPGQGQVRDFDISPDGRILAYSFHAGSSSRVILIDTKEWKKICSILQPAAPVRALKFSPDGMLLAMGTSDFLIHVWELSTRRLRTTLTGHSEWINSVAFSPDSRRLVSASNDGTARVWNLEQPIGRRSFSGPPGTGQLAFASEGKYLISQHDRLVIVWDVKEWKERARIDGCDLVTVGTAPKQSHSSKAPRSLFAVAKGEVIEIWDPSECRCCFAFRPTGAPIAAMALAGNPPVLATADKSGKNLLWVLAIPGGPKSQITDPRSRSFALQTITAKPLSPAHTTDLPVAAVSARIALSPTAARIATWPIGSIAIYECDAEPFVSGRQASTGEFVPKAFVIDPERSKMLGKHARELHNMIFSPDGKLLASTSQDSTVRLWDLDFVKERATLVGHTGGAFGVAFSPTGRTLASGGGDGAVRVWDVQTQLEFLAFDGHRAAVESVAFSPDGSMLASLCGQSGEPSEITICFAPQLSDEMLTFSALSR